MPYLLPSDQDWFFGCLVVLAMLSILFGLATLFVVICRGLSSCPYLRRETSDTSTDPKDH